MGQLAKTHATHPNYPNFHGIRQYRVLIIPFSAKLNVIPYRYITQHDTRSPSQHPHSWMEEQLKRNLKISSLVAISLSHLETLKALLKPRQFMVSLLIDDQTSTALETDCTVTDMKCTFLSYVLTLPDEGNSNCHQYNTESLKLMYRYKTWFLSSLNSETITSKSTDLKVSVILSPS